MTTFKSLKDATLAYNALEARLTTLEDRLNASAKYSKKLAKELSSHSVAIYKLRVQK